MAARKNTSRKRNKKQTKKKQDSQSFLKDEIIIYQLWLPVFYY